MTEQSQSPSHRATPQEEKLHAIAAVFGDAVAARIGKSQTRDAGQRSTPSAPDADRVAWQTNRLIHLLRERSAAQTSAQAAPQPRPRGPRPPPPLLAGEDLAAEHPAVIAHMLRDAPQDLRVRVLRALPGHMARMVMHRFRLG